MVYSIKASTHDFDQFFQYFIVLFSLYNFLILFVMSLSSDSSSDEDIVLYHYYKHYIKKKKRKKIPDQSIYWKRISTADYSSLPRNYKNRTPDFLRFTEWEKVLTYNCVALYAFLSTKCILKFCSIMKRYTKKKIY